MQCGISPFTVWMTFAWQLWAKLPRSVPVLKWNGAPCPHFANVIWMFGRWRREYEEEFVISETHRGNQPGYCPATQMCTSVSLCYPLLMWVLWRGSVASFQLDQALCGYFYKNVDPAVFSTFIFYSGGLIWAYFSIFYPFSVEEKEPQHISTYMVCVLI